MVGLAGAATHGWATIDSWLSRARATAWRPASLAAVVTLLLFDFTQWPFLSAEPAVSPFYEQIAQEPGDFAIAPFPADRQNSKYHMYYQITHGKKLTAGHVSRRPAGARDFLDGDPFMHALGEIVPDLWEMAQISRDFGRLRALDIKYVVLHRDQVLPELVDRVRAFLPLQPAYEDELLVAYRTDLVAGRDYRVQDMVTDDLGILRATASPPDEVLQGTFLGLEICWAAVRAPQRNLVLRVELLDQAATVVQAERRPLYGAEQTSDWSPGTIIIEAYRVRVDADIVPSVYELHIGAADQMSGEPVGEMVPVSRVEVIRLARVYDAPPLELGEQACFADRLCVLGYESRVSEGAGLLTIYWQALDQMDHDYVISYRLVDQSSRAFFWQRDAAPRDWSYPTSWLDVGEVISDTAAYESGELPSGRYWLEVAVYEPASGQRLRVSSGRSAVGTQNQVATIGEIVAE
jgi:hypothetical protein